MKLAEGLSRRGDAQKRLAQLQTRAVACARYQEGEEPAENAAELLAEAHRVGDEIEDLVRRINRTNAATELQPGLTITDAIAVRDTLSKRRGVVVAVADAAAGRERGWGRQLRSELREVTDLPVAQLRREADELARRYRDLDVRLQEANWATELAE